MASMKAIVIGVCAVLMCVALPVYEVYVLKWGAPAPPTRAEATLELMTKSGLTNAQPKFTIIDSRPGSVKMVASSPIAAGEAFFGPWPLDKLFCDTGPRDTFGEQMETLDEQHVATGMNQGMSCPLNLVVENSRGKESQWSDYIQTSLPSKPEAIHQVKQSEIDKCFKGTLLHAPLTKSHKALSAATELFMESLSELQNQSYAPSLSKTTPETALWAESMCNSRAFGLGKHRCLVPIADTTDHEQIAPTARQPPQNKQGHSFSLEALVDIKPGAEITQDYGTHHMEGQISTYGFATKDAKASYVTKWLLDVIKNQMVALKSDPDRVSKTEELGSVLQLFKMYGCLDAANLGFMGEEVLNMYALPCARIAVLPPGAGKLLLPAAEKVAGMGAALHHVDLLGIAKPLHRSHEQDALAALEEIHSKSLQSYEENEADCNEKAFVGRERVFQALQVIRRTAMEYHEAEVEAISEKHWQQLDHSGY